MKKTLKIVSFEAKNTRILKHVTISPDGNIVVLSGQEESGKSTVLDTIALTLGGGKQPARPIRDGQNSAMAKIELAPQFGEKPELTVTRIWDSRGSRLDVRGADGKPVEGGAQAVLDKLFAKISFAPLDFANEKDPKRQAETLRKLAGLDFAEIDAEIKSLYERRTDIGRDGKTAAGQLAGIAAPAEGTPDEEVSVAALMDEKAKADKINANADGVEREYQSRCDEVDMAAKVISRLQDELAAAESRWADAVSRRDGFKEEKDRSVRIDTTPIVEQIRSADAVNSAVRAKKDHAKKSAEVERLRGEYAELTAKIEALEAKKAERLASVKWPIDGLGIDDEGVTYKGLPFSQASESVRYRTSVAVGAAIAGPGRVMLLPAASGIGKKSLSELAKIAQEQDVEMWIERIGDGEDGAIVLEDGEIKAENPCPARA